MICFCNSSIFVSKLYLIFVQLSSPLLYMYICIKYSQFTGLEMLYVNRKLTWLAESFQKCPRSQTNLFSLNYQLLELSYHTLIIIFRDHILFITSIFVLSISETSYDDSYFCFSTKLAREQVAILFWEQNDLKYISSKIDININKYINPNLSNTHIVWLDKIRSHAFYIHKHSDYNSYHKNIYKMK